MNTENNLSLNQIMEQSFDFSDYGAEEKKVVIEETSGMIMEATMLRVLNDAPEEIQEKFGALIEADSDEIVMQGFIQENFPNFGEILVDEIAIFKSMGEETTKQAEEKIAA
jgi:hypothetical protein